MAFKHQSNEHIFLSPLNFYPNHLLCLLSRALISADLTGLSLLILCSFKLDLAGESLWNSDSCDTTDRVSCDLSCSLSCDLSCDIESYSSKLPLSMPPSCNLSLGMMCSRAYAEYGLYGRVSSRSLCRLS